MMKQFNAEVLFWISLLFVAFTTSILFYGYSSDGGGILSANLFIVIAICFFFILTKYVFAHKVQHFKITLFDILAERVLAPVLVIVLVSRYTTISISNIPVWILFVLLIDPLNTIKPYIQKTEAVQSGSFLRPIVSENPESNIDYLPAWIALAICFFMLWWRR